MKLVNLIPIFFVFFWSQSCISMNDDVLPYIDPSRNNISAWDIYDSSKRIQDINQRKEKLLEAFNAPNAPNECRGWAAHDIGALYAPYYEHYKVAVKYYEYALQYGDKDCKETTLSDIKNCGLSRYF